MLSSPVIMLENMRTRFSRVQY